MRSLPFTVLSLLFSCVQLLHARQPGTSTAVTITTSTSDATANAAESVLLASQSTSTAGAQAAVSLTHTTPIAAATTTASSNAQTSVVQATHTETGFVASASGSLGVDTAAGAAGSDTSSFNLSKGGLIAVVVIVVIVVVFGVASITLYILAKQRQWDVRASIKRASRRLTGRRGDVKSASARRKRSGAVTNFQARGLQAIYPPGHTKAVAIEVHDMEMGVRDRDAAKSRTSGAPAWLQKLRR